MNEPATPEKLLKLIVAAQKKKTIKGSKETMKWLNELKEILLDYLDYFEKQKLNIEKE